MIYAIYEPSGRIVSVVGCPPELIERHLAAEQAATPCSFGDGPATHFVDFSPSGGVSVMALPGRPAGNFTFDYAAHAWVFDALGAEREARVLRAQLFAESDWTQLPDVPIATQTAWANYRQALRDITDQPGFPTNIQWPERPV